MVKIFGKRGQAALEFLTTYGWAFMVILVMIGALAYFGVLSPKNLVPDKCLSAAGFTCKDYKVAEGRVDLNIVNGGGETLIISNFIIMKGADVVCSNADGSVYLAPEDTTGHPGDPAFAKVVDGSSLVVVCEPATGVVLDEKVKLTYTFDYMTSDGTYTHPSSGSITAKVQAP